MFRLKSKSSEELLEFFEDLISTAGMRAPRDFQLVSRLQNFSLPVIELGHWEIGTKYNPKIDIIKCSKTFDSICTVE